VAEFVSWETAARVATRVARQQHPLTDSERRSLESDFTELTAQAEDLVAAETGLRSLAGPGRARVADRIQWVGANVASFQRLLRPVIAKLEARAERNRLWGPNPLQISRQLAGAEVGLLLGWMSTRVLGQYDQLIIEEENPEDQDIVYYVGPNIVNLERRHGFPPREFRLWLALHEVTHRAQFTGVPWMRAHFLSLVDRALAGIETDPRQLFEAFRRSAAGVRAGRNPLDDGGLIALVASPEQFAAIQEIGGMMSLLEGHGDITMDRAGADLIPNAERFSHVLRQRRRQHGLARLLTVLVGLDAKMRQYEQGERFIEQVETDGPPGLLARVWEGPDWLPSWVEIRHPERWISRATAAGSPAPVGG
jgi:coenzyme F420 biosynthesis associated uncharacterized protein